MSYFFSTAFDAPCIYLNFWELNMALHMAYDKRNLGKTNKRR